MKRFPGHWTALAFGLAALGAIKPARAATDPAAPSTPAPDVASEAPPAVAASPPAASPPAAPADSAPARGSIRLKTEAPRERDSCDGPPLLLGRGKKVHVGAYGALGGAYTRFMGRDSGVVSFEAALLLDHRFSIGVAGYGFSRTPRGPDARDGERQEFGAGYGGLTLRYSWLSNLPIYPTFGVVLGAGAVNLHRDRGRHDDWDHGWEDDDVWRRGRFDPFLMVQPELALNANVTRWLRLGANVGYRFTGGVGRFGLDSGDLNGVVAGGTLAFGWF
jgi:hypothetical protein